MSYLTAQDLCLDTRPRNCVSQLLSLTELETSSLLTQRRWLSKPIKKRIVRIVINVPSTVTAGFTANKPLQTDAESH